MSPIKIGITLSSLRQPFRKAIDTAARLGARGVEVDARAEFRPSEMTGTAVRQVRKMLEDAGLTVCAVSFITRRGYNEPQELDRRVAATKDALKMAYELGAKVVVNRVGKIPAESEGQDWQMLIEALTDLSRYGQRVGSTLAARTGAEDGAALARLIDALPEGGLGVDFDPCGLIVSGFSASQSLESLGRHVLHMRARDGVRDLAQGRGLEVPLGRGVADIPVLAAMLEDFGYHGFFTVERQQSDDPVTDIANAVQFLRNM